jgi:hypothetical protein
MTAVLFEATSEFLNTIEINFVDKGLNQISRDGRRVSFIKSDTEDIHGWRDRPEMETGDKPI